MKEYLESKKNYKCYYNFVREKLFFFLNGLAGIKNFFTVLKYKKKNKWTFIGRLSRFWKIKILQIFKI